MTFGDVATATALATEADQLHRTGPGRTRLLALIAQAEGRLDAALRALEDEGDPDDQVLELPCRFSTEILKPLSTPSRR